MTTILVTGGNGLVGQAFQKYSMMNDSNRKWIFVSSKDADLRISEEVHKLFTLHKPDVIIHLASQVGGLFKNLNSQKNMFEDNTRINYNVLSIANELNIPKVISCLSTCIFPDYITQMGPISEKMLHCGPPHDSNYAYAYTKRMMEIQTRIYNEECDRQYMTIIPTNLYGYHDNFSLENGHVLPSLIHRCYLAKQNNEPLVVRGSGNPLRQFLHVDDLASIVVYLMDNYDVKKDDYSIIISPDFEYRIKDVVRYILNAFDYNNYKYDESYSDGQYRKTADNNKLKKLMPEYKFKRLDKGIKEVIEWFIVNYENARK